MLIHDGKEFRVLTEQVQKNKEDIAAHWAVDRVLADFGIKILGTLANNPAVEGLVGEEYGDAYLVGLSAPYNVWIWTRPNVNAGKPDPYWLNIGNIAIVGPQGPAGLTGNTGPKGDATRIYAGSDPTPGNVGDFFIELDNTDANGQVYQTISGGNMILVGNIRGPMGIQGPKGDKGAQGERGIQGEKGETGAAGGFIQIHGILNATHQLPTPASLNDLTVAYLVGIEEPFNLYIQVGTNSATATWNDMGPFNVGTAVYANGVYTTTWDSNTKLDRKWNNTAKDQVYVTLNNNGGQTTKPISENADANSVAVRNSAGSLVITNGSAANEAVTKEYVDGAFAPKLQASGEEYRVHISNNTNSLTRQVQYNNNTTPEANMIPTYRSSTAGSSVVNTYLLTGVPLKSYQAANKLYVDAAIAEVSGSVEVGRELVLVFNDGEYSLYFDKYNIPINRQECVSSFLGAIDTTQEYCIIAADDTINIVYVLNLSDYSIAFADYHFFTEL